MNCMKRLCVFAHWDRDNIIDDYVIYYLKALKQVVSTLVFVSDCDLPLKELEKLDGIADYKLAQKHNEYDFGSYKRGFLFAKENKIDFEELIFANDSCYGPFIPLENIFTKMSKKQCDFWGMTQNRYGITENFSRPKITPHIQSYFIVFKSNVFNSKMFGDFINSIKHEDEKNKVIIKYEIGLSQLWYSKGFTSATYIVKYKFVHNCMSEKWDTLVKKDKFPFIKTSIIKNGFDFMGEAKGWRELIQNHTDYPLFLVEKNSQRLQNLYENRYAKLNIYRKIRFNLLKNSPLEIRYCVIFLEKHLFIILNTLCFHKLKKF